MANDTVERKRSLMRRLLGDGLSRGQAEEPTDAAPAGAAEAPPPLPEAWIEPKSSQAKRQTLLKKRKLTSVKLLVGRRGSIAELADGVQEDYLISQHEPYTVSKRQCLLEIRGDEVWLRDLGSRYGTLVDGCKLGGRRKDATMEMRLDPGEHIMVPGPKGSRYSFKIVVK